MDFAVPGDHKVKIKENEEKAKYLDLARKLSKLSNMKVSVVLIFIGVLGTIHRGLMKCLEKLEIEGRVITIQTTTLRKFWRLKETMSLRSSERPSAYAGGENTERGIIIIMFD